MHKKKIRDIHFNHQNIIVRLDLNVPIQNNKITDNTRILKSLPTIQFLLEKQVKLIIISHLGRPQKNQNGNYPEKFSLKIVAQELEILLKQEIILIKDLYKITKAEIKSNNNIIFLLENIRFHEQETSKNIQQKESLAKKIANLGDFFVNDAFGVAHRNHASTTTLAQFLPSAIGLLMEKEIQFLNRCIKNPQKPFVVILGGAKISDKLLLIENLLPKVDRMLIGGGMSYTFLKAQGYEIGKSLLDENLIKNCKNLLKKFRDKIVLPIDVVVTDIDFSNFKIKQEIKTVNINAIQVEEKSFDIGEKTIENFTQKILNAQTVFWNGPMGVFECQPTAHGTWEIAKAVQVATEKKATSIVGGGDSIAALKKLQLLDKISFASSGGGASLEFLEGKNLPGITAIENN